MVRAISGCHETFRKGLALAGLLAVGIGGLLVIPGTGVPPVVSRPLRLTAVPILTAPAGYVVTFLSPSARQATGSSGTGSARSAPVASARSLATAPARVERVSTVILDEVLPALRAETPAAASQPLRLSVASIPPPTLAPALVPAAVSRTHGRWSRVGDTFARGGTRLGRAFMRAGQSAALSFSR